ncbi:MAG: hypothetical protein KGJ90_00485 [Patescibacteria group bacterium]|nr:hypothetical protein [Patescibacteria group bacterium]
MPAFNANQLSYQARNSNSVVILIGDVAVAFAQTVGFDFGYTTEQLYGVGSAKPQEIQQLRVGPTITLSEFALTTAGENIIQGGVSLPALLSNNSFNIHVVDGPSGEALYTYVGAVASNFNENIPSNQPITDAITFMAMDILDNNGNSLLNIPSAYTIPSAAAAGTGAAGNGLGLNLNASVSL